ncbi:glycosyltransferase family protein [Arthrobacter koreensis]|uniref:glycosyltransferase family protein n=1 Tax=Arthrobacter koreensis TaxID=199136 RepID=UPI000AB69A86|nr:glycosyltransferase [Arthrobacter koreensis]
MNSAQLKRSLWHLRSGGIGAYLEFRRRGKAENRHPGVRSYGRLKPFGRPGKAKLTFPAFEAPRRKANEPGYTVAVILDDFSRFGFGYEWHQVELHRASWKAEIEASKPDFLFVESAWSGNGGEWQYQFVGAHGPKPEIRALTQYCREHGIPTIFWNKEDPPHYKDFLETARLFDHVFTSDSERVASYKKDLGHPRVGVLQFAAQPAIHNPVRPRSGWHARDIAFAGMYFAHKYPERRAQLDLLLDAAMKTDNRLTTTGLEIFSRHSKSDPNYRFPKPYADRVVGSLSYGEMLSAYKAYKLFLNVNSVVDSPTMCARRIFEITAAGTTVVSTPSRALEQLWTADEQFIVQDRDQGIATLNALLRNPELSDRQLHLAQRRIWTEHTYKDRVLQIAGACLPPGKLLSNKSPAVSLLVSSMRPHQLEHVFRNVGSMLDVDVELVLLAHGFPLDRRYVADLGRRHGVQNVVALEQPKTKSLGECLNLCVEASSGDVLSKMDDDDLYSPHYLSDLLHALNFSGGDVVGKNAHYMYVADQDATILRFADKEHKFTHSVMGPTITGHRGVFEEVPFDSLSSGEDSSFLSKVIGSGGGIYSADRFNYAQYRGRTDHTWRVSDIAMLGTGDIKFFGSPENHITI